MFFEISYRCGGVSERGRRRFLLHNLEGGILLDFCNFGIINTHIYYSYIKEADWAALNALCPLLPAERQAQLERRQAAHSAQSIAATALLAFALQYHEVDFKNIPLQFIDFARLISDEGQEALRRFPGDWILSASGQPFPDGIRTTQGRQYVSLSHSGSLIAVALSDKPVGLDVQEAVPSDASAIFRRFAHPEEKMWMGSAPEKEAFLHWWTCKEAAVKLTGEGLAHPFSKFAVLPAEQDCCYHTSLDGKPVSLRCLSFGEGIAAIACYSKSFPLK